MNFLVKEVLYLLDYDDNIKETLFISTDKRTPGYAYEINIKDYNTGYSDLSFRMPCDITNENGETIKNPKLELLVPLSKVRYNRTIRYMGEDTISVPEPDGSTRVFPEEDGNRLLEDYTMDYIVQPLDKSRQGIGISLTYTAIDFPRFNLSKKKVGLTFDNSTITTKELSLYKNTPLSVPGSVQYLPWTKDMALSFQRTGQVQYVENLSSQNANPGDYYYVVSTETLYQKLDDGTWKAAGETDLTTWSPNAQAQTYPLDDATIKKLVNETVFSYGILATIYYWPVTASGRFQGVWYEEGGFITLSLYNTYEGSDWEGSDYLDSITYEWGHLDPIKHFLSPNNACGYMRYILQNTNWRVPGDKDLFIANTNSKPWFGKDEQPTGGEEGNYYITYETTKKVLVDESSQTSLVRVIGENTPTESDMSEAEAISTTNYIIGEPGADIIDDEDYITTVYRMENGKWENKTGTTFEQIVNTDITDDEFGTLYDIDIEQVEVARSAEASLGTTLLTDARYALSVSNANCYNAITSAAKLFDLYPVFDCKAKTATLKLNVGKDYGLTYRYKSNLKNSSVKVDGEKVITKLYVTGGTDAQGDQNITIGEANRIVSGIQSSLVTPATDNDTYLQSSLVSQMEQVEANIYKHIAGTTLSVGVNMSNQKFKLEFPDNLYELDIAEADKTKTIGPINIISFGSKSIAKYYNPTGKDYCYYIYINDGSDSYKDESKQLYKFDGANITLRRNLTEYSYPGIGSVTQINNYPYITTNIKYSPSLDARAIKDGNTYVGTVIDTSTNTHEYVLNDIKVNESFVLSGPDRVYVVPADKKAHYNYAEGNYYFFEGENIYRQCAKQYSETNSIYSKFNNISVNGYVFINLGTPTTKLTIKVDDKDTNVLDKNGKELTLADWFVNDFAMRVVYNGTSLIADEAFDPNAPEYITCRSPYGTSYIYNFKYLYDNGWISKEDILDIYRVNKEINDINLDFYDRYTKDLVNIQAAYNDAINNYDIYSSKADAQLEALMSQYWVNPNKASDGQFSAFPGFPADVLTSNFDQVKNKYYMDITYDKPLDNGRTETVVVERVYFDVFGTDSCKKNYPDCTANKTVARNPYTEGQYHVVANALGWDNYYQNKLTINSEIGGYTEAQDPSKTADSYNKFIQQMKEYYYRADQADVQMQEAQDALEELMECYEEWQDLITSKEKYLQENYGQFIIEGSYSNTEQPYANLLLKDGLEASEQYGSPDITYSVGVVDSSGLIEYRAPHKLICNDLIKRLHNVGQIAPHVGDYVAIQDEPMGMYGVPGLITQISRRVDDPYQNTITIDTSYTDADELVGNIITATNTVLNNKDIYGRAAIINNKGELSSTTVSNALSTGTNSISIISSSGKVAVDDNGLTCTNPHNRNEVMRYNGTGILGSSNGGATWRELLTQNGINANYINAGTINAGKVSITDGGHDITVMNSDGLVVKTTPNAPYVLGTLNENGITKAFENITVFVGRAANGEGVGYFNGYINATKGGNIAGWSISPTKLSSGSGNKYVGISSDGNYAFWAGAANAANAPFSVQANGYAHFTNILVDGNSTVQGNNIAASTITADKIVDGTITASELADRTITGVKIGKNVIAAEHIVANTITAGQIASGTITADEIKGGTITGSKIAAGTIGADHLSVSSLSAISANLGTVTAGHLKISKNTRDWDGVYFIELVNTDWVTGTSLKLNPYGIYHGGFSLTNDQGVSSGYTFLDATDILGLSASRGLSISSGYRGGVYGTTAVSIQATGDLRTNSTMGTKMNADYLHLNVGNEDAGGTTSGSMYLTADTNITISPLGKLYIRDNVAGSNKGALTGYIKYDHDGGASWRYLTFANGILVNVTSSAPSSYTYLA